jgi:hypothetical protein
MAFGKVEQERERVALRVRALLEEHPERVSGAAAFRLVVDLCSDRAVLHDGMAYIFAYGRHQGYNLPPYPLAGCGEIREFLSDQGVTNLPEWYERIGIDAETYHDFYRYRLLVCIDPEYRRHALPIKISWLDELDGNNHDHDAWQLACDVVDCVYRGRPLPGATSFF